MGLWGLWGQDLGRLRVPAWDLGFMLQGSELNLQLPGFRAQGLASLPLYNLASSYRSPEVCRTSLGHVRGLAGWVFERCVCVCVCNDMYKDTYIHTYILVHAELFVRTCS